MAAGPAFGATWELRRVSVGSNLDPQRYVVSCDISPNALSINTTLAGVRASTTRPLTTDIESIQAWVEGATTVANPPDFSSATTYTSWLARPNPYSEFKLVRANVTFPDGTNRIVQDPSTVGGNLAVWMGINCPREFGQ
jgi:hypothetical protein